MPVTMSNPIFKAKELANLYGNLGNDEMLKEIISDHNIVLDYWPLAEVSGMFWFGPRGNQPTIVINSDDSEDRQAYTIAHEIGHYILGHGRQFCIVFQDKQLNKIEQDANLFAEELLMPKKEVGSRL